MSLITEIGSARYEQLAQKLIEYCLSGAGRGNTVLRCPRIIEQVTREEDAT